MYCSGKFSVLRTSFSSLRPSYLLVKQDKASLQELVTNRNFMLQSGSWDQRLYTLLLA